MLFKKIFKIIIFFIMFMTITYSNGQKKIVPMSELQFQKTMGLYKDTMIETMFRIDSLKNLEIKMSEKQKEKIKKENKRLKIKNMLLVIGVAICIVVISIIQ